MNRIRLTGLITVFCCLLTGCAVPERAAEFLQDVGILQEKAEPTYEAVSGEWESDGMSAPSHEGYYVLHDGMYYPCCWSSWIDDKEFLTYYDAPADDLKCAGHKIAFHTDWETHIPTLYLSNGDRLIYYSSQNILNFYTFTKFWDLGYSLPMVNFNETVAGYLYITLTAENESDEYGCHLLPSDIKTEIMSWEPFQDKDKKKDYYVTMRFLALNGTDLSGDYVEDGIIRGLNRNETYLVNATAGSVNYDYTTTASYHYFLEGELYAEAEYETLYDDTYIIPVPEYLTSGYYMTGGGSMFRLVTEGDSYNLLDPEQFNEKSLYMDIAYALENDGYFREGYVYDAQGNVVYVTYGVYSSNPALNHYSTMVPGALGYRGNEDGEILAEGDGTEDKTEEPASPEDVPDTGTEMDSVHMTAWRFVPDAGELSFPENTILYTVVSDGNMPPCLIMQGTVALNAQKGNDGFSYQYRTQTQEKISEPFYVIAYYSGDNVPQMAAEVAGFSIEDITDEEQIRGILSSPENNSSRRS